VAALPVAVPFGQYVQGDSPVHRLDTRVKILVTMLFTVTLFILGSWSGLAVAAVIAVSAIALSTVPWRVALRGLKPVAWLLAFTLIANGLRWRPDEALLMLGPFGVDADGLRTGAFFAVRILLLVMGTSLVTLTSSPVALTDALSLLLGPLRPLRVPVDDIAMMLSIALRFMPTTAEEAERIVVAQTARGARFDKGGIVTRARAWVPVLVPLFVNLFRRADDLAVAMESRCYRGKGRTRLREPHMRTADWAVLAGAVVVAAAMVILL
jgi:energy-coupling factor transport system permease protein